MSETNEEFTNNSKAVDNTAAQIKRQGYKGSDKFIHFRTKVADDIINLQERVQNLEERMLKQEINNNN